MNNVTWVPIKSLRPAPYRSTHLLKPDFRLLQLNLSECGWLSPLLVRVADSTIIDGFHRWVIAQDPKMVKQLGPEVPILYQDVDEIDAMILHVRMNRAKGNIMAKPFSRIIQRVAVSGKYDDAQLMDVLCMSADEVDLMLDGSLLKKRKVSEHSYSKAWVPVEAPPDAVNSPVIERPPSPDR